MSICLFKRAVVAFAVLLMTACGFAVTAASTEDLKGYLPDRAGSFSRIGGLEQKNVKLDGAEFDLETVYVGPKGSRLLVTLTRVAQDARAYELLTATARGFRQHEPVEIKPDIGTAAFVSSNLVAFFKGRQFIKVSFANPHGNEKDAIALAGFLASGLDRGEGDIPVLVKHLPEWEKAQQTVLYLTRFQTLESIGQDTVLDAVVSEGDADAVLATYGNARLLLIEFNTPQRAAENDRRIIGKIQELWKLGQPAPTAYRRIGNYSVFVFDAQNEQAAKQLIDQVKYEQVVSWLGENPNIFKAAERYYVETTLGVLVAVLKASGFALIGCVATGGLIGALLFLRRRSQQHDVEAFSDAGGMLRLNIDEMTPQTDPSRLLEPH